MDVNSDSSMDVFGSDNSWKAVRDGAKCRIDNYKPKLKARYLRFIFKCQFHTCCYKKRTLSATTRHGRVEPLAYLHVWHLLGSNLAVVPDKQTHVKKRPSKEQVAEWVAINGADFTAEYFDP